MENSKHTAQIIGAALVGVAVGAVVGMLFAPEKGKKTRKRLMKGAEDAAENLTSTVKDQINALRHEAEQLEKAAKSKVNEYTQAAKQKVDNLQ
ncbi:MAG: YtxH domain-containing protein [Bacteroidetes bacterium]|nr:YtxH domain-containing protein [Bacteroidota bacterium]